jgi:hypothetical protein
MATRSGVYAFLAGIAVSAATNILTGLTHESLSLPRILALVGFLAGGWFYFSASELSASNTATLRAAEHSDSSRYKVTFPVAETARIAHAISLLAVLSLLLDIFVLPMFGR